ncbi:MAG: DUF4065 domain-containing protein [Thermoplasmatales archaeon]
MKRGKMISGVELVEFILKHAGPVPQKKLQKLAYLCEIEYIIKHGQRLSDLTFKRYYYGPYSDDIRNIEGLDDNIVTEEKTNGLYTLKESKIKTSRAGTIKPEIEQELVSYIKKYNEKSGKELESIADNTDPYLETEKINDPIDLDGYAWYYSKINSDDFWKAVEMKDEENIKNGVYGRHIIKNKEELNSYLMG